MARFGDGFYPPPANRQSYTEVNAMSILKIGLYVLPFVVAWVVLTLGMGVGLLMEPTAGPTLVVGTILVAAAILTAVLNVGWIVAYKSK